MRSCSRAARPPSRFGRCSPRPRSPTWGVYSGYELFENVPLRPGSEEYLDSEKYQYRPRDYAAAEAAGRSLAGYLTRLNQIRREHVALHRLRNLQLHSADNTQILTFSKQVVTDDATTTRSWSSST